MKKSFYTIGLILLLALDSSAFSTKTIKSDPKNIIKADKILYDSNTNILEAIGNVRLVNGNYYVAADRVVVNTETKEIWVDKRFYAEGEKARLIADYFYNNEKDHILHLKNAIVEFNDADIMLAKEIKSSEDGIFKIKNGTFSSCKACINQHPIWQIKAEESYLHTKTQRVIYKNTRFLIGKQTIMYWPFFSHYLKGAEAQSGILMPSNYHSSLRVPLYLRLRPNIDLTYTPRFMQKNLIHELEFRHLLKNGHYTIYHSHMHGGSVTENPKSKSDRFHSKISGNYHSSWADYEYLYENISDVSYLKNYYYDNRPYLKSYIYGQQLDSQKQISIGVKKYKGLRSIDSNETDPYLGPVLYARERLDFENGWSFLAADEFMRYSEKHKNIVRNNLTMSLSRFFYGNIGQQVNISLTNFLDFYAVEKLQKTRVSIRNKTAIRNTPELQIGGRMPFYTYINTTSLMMEPQINILYSPTQKRPFNNIYLIDSPSIDISDVNIFNNSRYSGTDFREEGFRISYGVNNHISDANWDVGFFIGQALSRDNNTSGSKSNYVGRAYLKLGDNMNLYYSFLRRAANFKPVRDELSINLLFKKIKIDNSITFLREIKEQAMREGAIETIPNRSIRQSYSKISINLNDNLTLFGDMRVDFSRKGYPRPLNQAIGMSYNYDCVAFTIRLNENYAQDTNRGIIKTSSHSATIGLKSINM